MSIYLPKWRQIDIFCVFYRKDLVKKDFFCTFALFFKVHYYIIPSHMKHLGHLFFFSIALCISMQLNAVTYCAPSAWG
jgi:hypothetical protein